MRRTAPFSAVLVGLAFFGALWPTVAEPAQRRRPPPRRGTVVFVGGYFYDPFFGPYPWWTPSVYPRLYYPVFDDRSEVRVRVEPKHAAVYVDGYYAGIVDDFDGVLQRLPLSPGPHEIDLYLEGFRTIHQHLYLGPGSSYTLRERLEQLTPGEMSAPPTIAPPIPPPPPGSARLPRTPSREPTPPTIALSGTSFGTLAIRVQPTDAQVTIDGETWTASASGDPLAVQVADGLHHIEVQKKGFKRYSSETHVQAGETTALNVSLSPES